MLSNRLNIPTHNGIRVSIRNSDLGSSDPMAALVMAALDPNAPTTIALHAPQPGYIQHEYYLGPKGGYVFDVFRKDGVLIRRDVRESELSRKDGVTTVKAGF